MSWWSERVKREGVKCEKERKIVFIPYENSIRVVTVPSIEDAYDIFEGMDTDLKREKCAGKHELLLISREENL